MAAKLVGLRSNSSNSAKFGNLPRLIPRGLEQSMGVGVFRGDEQETARHRGALRKVHYSFSLVENQSQ